MPNLSTSYIDSLAPNREAADKAIALAKKGAFVGLHISSDQTLLFGECEGSGKDNYKVSADFIDPAAPVLRCSCPSRQLPCKHGLGILYAYQQNPKVFSPADLPADVIEKRGKLTQKKENAAKPKSTEPKKVNKAALAKKIEQQIEGLNLAASIVEGLLVQGLASLSPKNIQVLREQLKVLESHYIPGVVRGFQDFLLMCRTFEKEPDALQSWGLERLTRLYFLCNKGRDHLDARRADPELKPETDSAIEELLGHIWTLDQLKTENLVMEKAEITQLGFYSYNDPVREEFVDLGLWCEPGKPTVYETRTYRPYRAKAHVKEEDSSAGLLSVKNLYIYPGELNKRIRWDEMTMRARTAVDLAKVREHAQQSIPDMVKQARGQLKSLLAARDPAFLLAFKQILVGEFKDGRKLRKQYAVEDMHGNAIALGSPISRAWNVQFDLIESLGEQELRNAVLLGRCEHHISNDSLSFVPVSIVSAEAVVPLAF